MRDERVAVIDGLRGIAIMAVLYQHLFVQHIVRLLGSGKDGYPWLLQFGWMGVGLFFILSGFVLSLPYWQGRRAFGAGVTDFYMRRAWRLIPLFVFASVIAFIVDGTIPFSTLAFDLTTLNTFTRAEFMPSANEVFWSIDLEIWFSVLFPMVFIGLRYMPRFTMGAVVFIALVLRVAGATLYPDERINFLKDSVFGRLDDFLLGILIAKVYCVRGLETKRGGAIFATGVTLIGLTQIGWDAAEQHILPAIATVLLHTAWQAGFVLMIWGALYSRGWLQAALASTPLRACGVMCFSIYTWHYLIMTPAVRANPTGTNLLGYLAALAVVSILSFLLIERGDFTSALRQARLAKVP